MPNKLNWLNSEQDYEYAYRYIYERADSEAYAIAKAAGSHLSKDASKKEEVEAAITALLDSGYSNLVRRLNNGLRQYRLRKTRSGWKQRTFTLPDSVNNSLAKLARDYMKPQASIIAELVNETNNLLQLQEAKYEARTAKKNLIQATLIESHEKRNRVLQVKVEQLEEQLLKHVQALTMWELSMGADTPPFDGDLDQARLKALATHKKIVSKIQSHANVYKLLPSETKTPAARQTIAE